MLLSTKDIRLILDKIGRKVVVPPSEGFHYEIVEMRSLGYSDDPEIRSLQSKLSIMLQVASDQERGSKD